MRAWFPQCGPRPGGRARATDLPAPFRTGEAR